jgi:flagellin-like protein
MGEVKNRGKKGLSPVIATVLLIMLVLFLAAIVFLWARGFISEQIEKFGKPVEEQCVGIDFSIAVVRGKLGQHALEVVNHGNVDIYRLDIKKTLGGNSEVTKFKFNIPSGSSEKGDTFLMMENKDSPESITVYPVLLGNVRGIDSNKVFTCVELGRKIPISDLV